jgi:hypothetical protein
MMIEFDWMYEDSVRAHIEIDKDYTIKQTVFGDSLFDTIFSAKDIGGNEQEREKVVNDFFESRCFPRTRERAKGLLKLLGVAYYNGFLICRKTHGVTSDDCYWIRFKGKDLKWKDVNIRGNV